MMCMCPGLGWSVRDVYVAVGSSSGAVHLVQPPPRQGKAHPGGEWRPVNTAVTTLNLMLRLTVPGLVQMFSNFSGRQNPV